MALDRSIVISHCIEALQAYAPRMSASACERIIYSYIEFRETRDYVKFWREVFASTDAEGVGGVGVVFRLEHAFMRIVHQLDTFFAITANFETVLKVECPSPAILDEYIDWD